MDGKHPYEWMGWTAVVAEVFFLLSAEVIRRNVDVAPAGDGAGGGGGKSYAKRMRREAPKCGGFLPLIPRSGWAYSGRVL